MSLRIKLDEAEASLCISDYDSSEQCINCSTFEDQSFSICLNYPLKLEDTYNPGNFASVLLQKKNLAENHIYKVIDKDSDTRMGWCIPIQALCSKEHSFAADESFLRFAYIATYHLIQTTEQNLSSIPTTTADARLSLSDFFPEDVAVLVISIGTPDNRKPFILEEWVPSLFGYGFSPAGESERPNVKHIGITPSAHSLNLRRVSSKVEGRPFLDNMFSNIIPFEDNPLLLFFYQYQIIELFLEQVFQEEHAVLIRLLIDAGTDTVKAKDVLSKINALAPEKKRIELLFGDYVEQGIDRTRLFISCNSFLREVGQEECGNMHHALYRVRNILFHQYRNIPAESLQALADICVEFSHLLVQLVSRYKGRTEEPAEQTT